MREFFGLKDLTRLQPIIFGAMIVGEMVGMAMPGLLYDAYGTYSASLAISFVATIVTVVCFLIMCCTHPLGPAPRAHKKRSSSELV